MPMDPDKMLDLGAELRGYWDRLAEITEAAKKENRDLSRRERAEVQEIRGKADEIRARQPKFDPRMVQGTPFLGAGFERDNSRVVLGPEQRVADWAAVHAGESGGTAASSPARRTRTTFVGEAHPRHGHRLLAGRGARAARGAGLHESVADSTDSTDSCVLEPRRLQAQAPQACPTDEAD